jgi:hypothetical protein
VIVVILALLGVAVTVAGLRLSGVREHVVVRGEEFGCDARLVAAAGGAGGGGAEGNIGALKGVSCRLRRRSEGPKCGSQDGLRYIAQSHHGRW